METGKAPARSRPGRVCTHDGCGTLLSVYNKRSKCSVHERTLGAPRTRGRKNQTAA